MAMSLALGVGTVLAWAEPGKPAAPAPEASSEAVRFFETKIRPLFAAQCYACHGEKNGKGGLRLHTAADLRKGGDSGAAVVPGDPDKSLLMQALRYDGPVQMPPQGKLKPGQLEDVAAWIRSGAPYPVPGPGSRVPGPSGAKAGAPVKPHWAFQPVRRPAVPQIRTRPEGTRSAIRNPIDAFVQAKLRAKGLSPSPEASRRELIRRAYFDLIGLPPSPDEVDAFLADRSPDAWEKVVDGLLARPQFGERWGRHWLDVVRFAQTNGYERDDEKPHAWRYRDYVIKSFNQDKPYDRFIKEHLAGDELEPVTDDSLTATAFYRLGVWDDEPDDARQAEYDNLDDVLSTASQSFMGLTVGCARCHDHKFDPIPQREYYGLLAFMRNVRRYTKPDDKNPSIFATLSDGAQTLAVTEDGAEAPKTQVLIRGNAATPGPEVEPRFIQALCAGPDAAAPELPQPAPNAKTSRRRRVLADWIASSQHPLTARVMANRVWQHLFGRGIVPTPNDFGRTGMEPSNPELLDYLAARFAAPQGPESKVLSHESPVARTGDSGPGILDSGLGWSVKGLIRLIMRSSTYKQTSRVQVPNPQTPKGHPIRNPQSTDPGNALFWRQNLRRLEAEAIRDSILAASGKLNLKMGGRGIFPVLPPEVLATQSRPGNGWDKSDEAERSRRSVYIFAKRTLGVPILETFDAATPDSSVAARATTTIAPQALILLNSAFMDEQSAAFAERLLREAGTEPEKQIERAFRLAVARQPSPRELGIAREYLDAQRLECGGMPAEEASRRALAAFCKVVLNLNEFVYLD